jgi:hypothetical protein
MSFLGKRGGRARAERLTAEQLSAIARMGAVANHKKAARAKAMRDGEAKEGTR